MNLSDLFDHFKSLYDTTDINNNDDNNNNINNLRSDTDEPLIYDEDLDSNITEKELRTAIFSQKSNKSAGSDNLVAEVFKSTYDLFQPFLLKLFNRMFN